MWKYDEDDDSQNISYKISEKHNQSPTFTKMTHL